MILAFLGLSLAAWGTIAAVGAVAVGTWQVIESQKARKAAKSTAKKSIAAQMAAQAGEQAYAGQYLEMSKHQMELTAKQREIDTLAGLIVSSQEKSPRIMQTPRAPTERSAIENLNVMLDKLFR